MNTLRTLAVLSLCLLSGAALAQEAGSTPPDEAASPVIESLKGLHGITAGNLMATAEALDEAMYAYQPTDSVRTAGRILAHVANAQYAFCSSAAGEESPNQENLEETATTKADITAALAAAFAYCEGVYDATTDAEGAVMRNFFGSEMAASGILAFNSAHNYEHYGNLVTYMRMNGMVPPSSQR